MKFLHFPILVIVLLLLATLPSSHAHKVVTLTDANFSQVVNDYTKNVFVFFSAPWNQQCKKITPIWQQLSMEDEDNSVNDRVVIAEINAYENAETKSALQLSKKGIRYPTFILFPKTRKNFPTSFSSDQDGIYYDGDDDWSLEGFKRFLRKHSEHFGAPPTSPEELNSELSNLLVTLDDSNFTSFVSDPTKNVFVRFFAPWSGHCKHLAPTWHKLAQDPELIAYSRDHNNDVVIAEIDGTDTGNRQIFDEMMRAKHGVSFPTLTFFTKSKKKLGIHYGAVEGEGIDYGRGPRNVEELKKFIFEHAEH